MPYQTTHNGGDFVMGNNRRTSVVNRYLHCWDAPNLFIMGACAFPFDGSHNPTGTVGALTYWSGDAIKDKYLRKPGAPL